MHLKKKNYGEKYREAVSWEFPKDVSELSADKVELFDRIFVYVLGRTNIGYSNKEAEMALRLAERQDVTELRSLEYLLFKYDMEKNNTNTKKEKLDEVFSIILDYDILLKRKNAEVGRHYSPIDEMTQAIKKGTVSTIAEVEGGTSILGRTKLTRLAVTPTYEEVDANVANINRYIGAIRDNTHLLKDPSKYLSKEHAINKMESIIKMILY